MRPPAPVPTPHTPHKQAQQKCPGSLGSEPMNMKRDEHPPRRKEERRCPPWSPGCPVYPPPKVSPNDLSGLLTPSILGCLQETLRPSDSQ